MNKDMTAYCGDYCEDCIWKDRVGCTGCKVNKGDMFWGECDKAKCCIQNNFEHCGECPQMPCDKLLSLFKDPEHGDDGSRLINLKNWAVGNYS
ncbi:MAG: DUF3795 domain-containing protein [bacterium]|nr:DUF3795 domain-containing protein [bacterium]